MNRMERKKERTRKSIHENALKLIEKKGVKRTTMREIAQKSDIAVGTLYNYYNSKASLIISILEEKFESIPLDERNIINKFKEDKNFTPLDLLYYWMDYYLEKFFLLNKKNIKELMSIIFSNENYLKRGMQIDTVVLKDLTKILNYLQKINKLKTDIDIKKASYSIYSIFLGQTWGYLYYFKNMNKKEFRRGLKKMIKMFYTGIKK